MPTIARFVSLLLPAIILVACGQKGPLFIEQAVKPTTRQSQQPAPKAPETQAPIVEPSPPN
jgi:predicted small lipoprotein YifL